MNKVTLCGTVGNEPTIRTVGDAKVASISLATSKAYKDKDGQWQELTTWHRVDLWRGLAATAEKIVHKGSKVLVEGSLSYTQREVNGVKQTFTQITAEYMEVLNKVEPTARPSSEPAF